MAKRTRFGPAPGAKSTPKFGVDGSGGIMRSRPRRFQTTRGKRRLSYAEAYYRRTTDSSRARVMALYGKTAPPKPVGPPAARNAPIAKGEDSRRMTPVTSTGPKPYTPGGPSAPMTNPGGPSVTRNTAPRRRRRRRPRNRAATGSGVY